MVRDRVKARKVGDSLVITLTKPVMEEAEIAEGDSLLLETISNGRIIVRKEAEPVAIVERVGLELDILKKRKAATQAEIEMVVYEHNNSMPTAHPYIEDDLIMAGVMRELSWEIAKLDVGIAEKHLEVFELGGLEGV